ncbi:MAG: HU family DNA-binding protein [Candidatus Firestonebacteria bacterium]
MVRSDMVKKVAKETGLSAKDTEKIVDVILESVVDYVQKGKKIELRGFGTFMVKQRAGRIARNLKTNEDLPLPSRKVIYFKAGKELKNIQKEEK